MIKTFCDQCGKEVENDNPGRVGHSVTSGDFQAIVNVRKNDKADDCDLCLGCLIEMLTTTPKKPRKPRSDKGSHKEPKTELVLVTATETTSESGGIGFPPPLTKGRGSKKIQRGATPLLPDISTFKIRSPEPGKNEPSVLSIGEVAIACVTLRTGALDLLAACGVDQKYVEAQPESEGKRNLLDILNPTPSKA